jgi:hypothetical protein
MYSLMALNIGEGENVMAYKQDTGSLTDSSAVQKTRSYQ